MTRVGPAVFNGGLSTLLAFILLSTSRSYVFLSFFKVFTLLLDIFADLFAQIFFLICVLGLFHGLLVLPVLLALFGPPSRQPAIPTDPQSIGKATARSSLHRDNDEGDRDIDRAYLQQDLHNVDITRDAINESTSLHDGGGEVEQGMEVELEVERGGGGGEEEEEGFLIRGRGSSVSIENTRA